MQRRPATVHISFDGKPWRVDKELGEYDVFTLEFIQRLPSDVPYVLVSGYPALLFGRTRNTEDIDLLVERMDEGTFTALWKGLSQDYECINTSDPVAAYQDYLLTGIALRFARKGTIEPNMEFKFVKNEVEQYACNSQGGPSQ